MIFRSPIDLGCENLIRFNHEFVGKAALQKELEEHHNTAVHLIWDKASALNVMAGSMNAEKQYDTLDLAGDYDHIRNNGGRHIDAVYDGDKMIGASSGRILSPKTREMISICTIDTDYAVGGKGVEILWGNPGTNQVRIKVAVSLFPYIKERRNTDFDIESIPHPKF